LPTIGDQADPPGRLSRGGPRRSEGHISFHGPGRQRSCLASTRRMRGRQGWGDVSPFHVDQPQTAYRRTIAPLRKRHSSTNPRSSRTPSGKNRFPLPTTTGQTIIWNSSTRPALIACAASSGPSTVMSCSASALSRRTASGSNSRSILVRALRGSTQKNDYLVINVTSAVTGMARRKPI
jgi:hypothetical protein